MTIVFNRVYLCSSVANFLNDLQLPLTASE